MFEKLKAIASVTVKEISTQYNLGEKISQANNGVAVLRNKLAKGLNNLANELKTVEVVKAEVVEDATLQN